MISGARDEELVARAIQRQRVARAPGTNANYKTAVKHYISYCNEFEVPPGSPSVQHVCVFIEYLADFLAAPGSILNYMASVRRYVANCEYHHHNWYAHRVKLALDAVTRDKSHIPVQRPPIPTQVLYAAFKHMARQPYSAMFRLIMAVLYFSALRQSEVIIHTASQFDPQRHLLARDITLRDGALHLYIKHSKNMSAHDRRRTVILHPTGDPLTCPVILYKDMRAVSPHPHSKAPAFTYPNGAPVLVTHVVTRLRTAIAAQGIDPRPYTLHSLRRSATTEAYHAGHTQFELQNSAAWSSHAYKQYIHTDSQSRVNKTLIQSFHQ